MGNDKMEMFYLVFKFYQAVVVMPQPYSLEDCKAAAKSDLSNSGYGYCVPAPKTFNGSGSVINTYR